LVQFSFATRPCGAQNLHSPTNAINPINPTNPINLKNAINPTNPINSKNAINPTNPKSPTLWEGDDPIHLTQWDKEIWV